MSKEFELVTMGIDVRLSGLSFVIREWHAGKSALIDRGDLGFYKNPYSSLQHLIPYFKKGHIDRVVEGKSIDLVLIDRGPAPTEVYEFCREVGQRVMPAIGHVSLKQDCSIRIDKYLGGGRSRKIDLLLYNNNNFEHLARRSVLDGFQEQLIDCEIMACVAAHWLSIKDEKPVWVGGQA